jgi:hypothetical protein
VVVHLFSEKQLNIDDPMSGFEELPTFEMLPSNAAPTLIYLTIISVGIFRHNKPGWRAERVVAPGCFRIILCIVNKCTYDR